MASSTSVWGGGSLCSSGTTGPTVFPGWISCCDEGAPEPIRALGGDLPPERGEACDRRGYGLDVPGDVVEGFDDPGVESNSRLTATTAVVLIALFLVVGVTLVNVRGYLDVHVFVGMLLIPPALVKIGSTGWRFARYYAGSPPYRRKGPPPALLRILGPVLVVLTAVLVGSGIALILTPHLRSQLLFLHQASFFGWLVVMTIHVLGHLKETARLAPRDLTRRTRIRVGGASARQGAVMAALVVGALLGLVMLTTTAHYLGATVGFIHHHHH